MITMANRITGGSTSGGNYIKLSESATEDSSINVSGWVGWGSGGAISDDGRLMTLGATTDGYMVMFDCADSLGVDTMTHKQSYSGFQGNSRSPKYSEDGTKFMYIDIDTYTIYTGTATTPFSVSSITGVTSWTDPNGSTYGPSSVNWSTDGRVVLIGDNSATLFSAALSTPFDISSASITSVVVLDTTYAGTCGFNKEGTLLFTAGYGTVRTYILNTPFDIESLASTAAYDSFSAKAASGLFFNDAGTHMYCLAGSGEEGLLTKYRLDRSID